MVGPSDLSVAWPGRPWVAVWSLLSLCPESFDYFQLGTEYFPRKKPQPIAPLQERRQERHTDCREPLRASDVPAKPDLRMRGRS